MPSNAKRARDPLRTGIFGVVLVVCVVLIAFGYAALPFFPQGKIYDAYFSDAGGINPGYYTASDINGTSDGDVLLAVVPPPQMPATMAQGTIQGYCVGEPWNQQAVLRGIGVSVVTDYEVWKNNPEKVFGVTAAWAAKNPNTHLAVIKALIRAGQWLDASPENQEKIRRGTAKMDHSEHGGAPVLGVRGVVIKCHGRATARTITNAIRLTSAFIKGKLNEHIVDELRKLSVRSAWFGKWFGSKEDE